MAKSELTYAKAYSELESIVNMIENEDVDIDNLSKNVKRASELIRFCKEKLINNQKEIDVIMKSIESDDL